MPSSFVQGTGGQGALVTSLAKAFVSNVTAGNTIAVAISIEFPASTVTSVTDNLSNTYTQATTQVVGDNRQYLFYALNISGGACTVTVNVSASTYVTIGIAEASGVVSSSALDVTDTGTGSSSAAATGSFTTSVPDIIFATVNHNSTATITPAGGWSQIYEQEDWNNFATINFMYRTGAAGSYNGQWTLSSSTGWLALAMALKDAGGVSIPVMMKYYRSRRV